MFLNKDCLHVFYQDPLNFSGDPTKVFASKYSTVSSDVLRHNCCFKAPTGFGCHTAFTRKRTAKLIRSLLFIRGREMRSTY